jgi:hypothetical protein
MRHDPHLSTWKLDELPSGERPILQELQQVLIDSGADCLHQEIAASSDSTTMPTLSIR